MTVYFICAVGRPEMVKIGYTTGLPARMQNISAEFEGGIELLAHCDGGPETERAFHAMLADSRVEGEWFRRSERLDEIITTFKSNVAGKRIWSRLRAVAELGTSPIDADKQIAFDLLQQLMSKFGAVHFGVAQGKAFDELHAINPLWTRRRVRAIWEKKTRRIDHFEIRDIGTVLSAWSASSDEQASA